MYLNCYYKVTAKFALPVLNETTAKILRTFGTTETSTTTKWWPAGMLGQFFDCLSVTKLDKYQKKTQPFLKTYINENHKRLCWMASWLLPYPNEWKEAT